MSRHTKANGYTAIKVEGGILPAEFLQTVAAAKAPRQAQTDYGLTKSFSVKDEIGRAWRTASDLWDDFRTNRRRTDLPLGRTCVRQFLEPLLAHVFRFGDLTSLSDGKTLGDRRYPFSHEAAGGAVPILLTTPDYDLDKGAAVFGDGVRRRSPHGLIQEYLNAEDTALWGIVSNGTHIRMLRDNPSLTRPAYLEADLERIFEEQLYPDFAVMWLVFHATRFRPDGADPKVCILEAWRKTAIETGERAREKLQLGVIEALKTLGQGFLTHPDNETLRRDIRDGVNSKESMHQELLRLIYRLLFLFTAEDRGLLHDPAAPEDARELYAEGYSLSRLRERSRRRRYHDRYGDMWVGLKLVFGCLARGEPALGLPALGGLFGAEHCPRLDAASLSNEALMTALLAVGYFRSDRGKVLQRINYRNMDTEELGSVYESLLELHPVIDVDVVPWRFGYAELSGNDRKTSGSYYTPPALVEELIKSALVPVIERTIRENPTNPTQALLDLNIIDPACGSGHFLLAAARRLAAELARLRAGADQPDEEVRRHALRDVVRHCIHGVDRNPLAVELCRTALWIETVEPGKPLGFLDAGIRCGDALLGVFDLEALRKGIPEDAFKPLAGDDKETAKHFGKRNKAERAGQGALDFTGGGGRLPDPPPLAGVAQVWRTLPEDNPDQIAEKRRRFEAALADPRLWRWRVAADLYVAAFLIPKTGGVPANQNTATIPTTGHVWQVLSGGQPYGPLVARAQDVAGEARAFHWPLEFSHVMAAGGFDVVLGNPPWERIKLQEQEFFAARAPDIAAAANAAARGRMIAALAKSPEGSPERALHEAFEIAKRIAESSSVFARIPGEEGGRFPLTGRGDVNTYALFAELTATLTNPRGRAGVIVPTGIGTDATTAPFFEALVINKRLHSFHDFQTGMGFFDRIGHARFKFCLLTMGAPNTGSEKISFSFFSRTIEDFADRRRHFALTGEDIERVNPNTRTAPVFRSSTDAELTAKIYARVPVLINESKGPAGNPWGISFLAMFHMSNDSGLFHTAAQLTEAGFVRDGSDWMMQDGITPRQRVLDLDGGRDGLHLDLSGGGLRTSPRYVPLYEAKMIHQFDHRWATYDGSDSRDAAVGEKADLTFEPTPRYWVPEQEVIDRLSAKGWKRKWLMGWRDICRSTDERTVIAAATPRVGVGHTAPLFFTTANPPFASALLANWGALVLDYAARQKVGGTHLTYGYLHQLPILPPSVYSAADLAFIVPRVLELTYTSHSMAPFVRDLGYEGSPFAWNEERRARLRAELDAWYARAYGLSLDELRYILDPADVKGADYPSETFRGLKNNEMRRFDEYRTRRLVLEAWDRMEKELRLADEPGADAAPVLVELPLDSLRDGAWAWPSSIQQPDRLRYAAQHVLWLMDMTKDGSRIRFVVAGLAEPALLTQWLTDAGREQWIRLVGREARPASGVVRLRPMINEAWRSMFETLLTSGQLEERADGAWMRGQYFDVAGLRADSPNAQRAAFAIRAIRQVDVDSLTASVVPENNVILGRLSHG